ncbi:MAG: beta-lactamase family protein [Deltaproteobacteria bacterium]|nr:beta-lactamase family protein [Deltaproteobacteria bacterium]
MSTDELIKNALNAGMFESACVLVGNSEKVLYHKAFGGAGEDSIFNIGTLTQSICTSLILMQLVAEKHLNLNSSVAKYLPEFGEEGKNKVTLKQLLKHTSGLPKSGKYLNEDLSVLEITERICYEELEFPPAFEKMKSDLGYIILGAVIEKISGMKFQDFFESKIAGPLGLSKTSFPIAGSRAVLGHTGLSSTASDCWKIATAILQSYSDEREFIPKPVIDEFIGPKARYKLGREKDQLISTGIMMISDTGCFLWMDLEKKLIIEIFTSGKNTEAAIKWIPSALNALLSDILPQPSNVPKESL